MSLDWEKLKISPVELDRIFEPDLINNWAITLGRVLLLNLEEYRLSLFWTEFSLLFLSLLFFFPVSLIVFRDLALLNNNPGSFVVVLLSALSLSLIGLGILNCYLWQRAKKLKRLTKLWQKVMIHNKLLDDLQLLSELDGLSTNLNLRIKNHQTHLQSIVELKSVFDLTKNSLLRSIELEALIYNHQKNSDRNSFSCHNRYQLLTNLENNLANLSLLDSNSGKEYQDILTEAVNLGLSIHQEISKI